MEAARTIGTSPYLEEKIILAIHPGLPRGSLSASVGIRSIS